MKKVNVLILLLSAVFLLSCSSEPKRLSEEQINKLISGKNISSVSFMSSGDLKYDYPARVSISYVENGEEFYQLLSVEELEEPKNVGVFNEKRKFTASTDELFNFNIDQALENAISFIQKESNDAFEYFAIESVSVSAEKNWKGEKKICRTLKLQATKKNEKSEYKFSHRTVTEVQNYYEFEFDILEDATVKFKK